MEQTRDNVRRHGEVVGCELLNFFVRRQEPCNPVVVTAVKSFDTLTRPSQAVRIRFRVIVLVLASVALACAASVTVQSLYRASQRKRILTSFDPCLLAGEGLLEGDGHPRRVLVIESHVSQWPGPNPEYLVLTDMNYHVLHVLPSRPESIFMDHSFDTQDSPQALTVRRSVRPGFQTEIIKYAANGTKLREISRVLDPPEFQLPADFNLRDEVRAAKEAKARE